MLVPRSPLDVVYLSDILGCISIRYTGVFAMSKSAPINMRAEPSQHQLLTKAAAILHKDRSAFILEVACREAENVLLDQRLFQLDTERFDAFETALAERPETNDRLKALLAEPTPWQ